MQSKTQFTQAIVDMILVALSLNATSVAPKLAVKLAAFCSSRYYRSSKGVRTLEVYNLYILVVSVNSIKPVRTSVRTRKFQAGVGIYS